MYLVIGVEGLEVGPLTFRNPVEMLYLPTSVKRFSLFCATQKK